MEAQSVPAGFSTDLQPRAKDGGVAAGMAAVIREVGALLANSGGLVVVVVGVIAVMTITTASVASVPGEQAATVAAGAFTVLGTIVGAYFGVRVGAHGKSEAEDARVASEAKVARLALHVDKQDAARVLHDLER
jgi:hypothetical protein